MILSQDAGKQYKYDDIKENEIRSIYNEFTGNYK